MLECVCVCVSVCVCVCVCVWMKRWRTVLFLLWESGWSAGQPPPLQFWIWQTVSQPTLTKKNLAAESKFLLLLSGSLFFKCLSYMKPLEMQGYLSDMLFGN